MSRSRLRDRLLAYDAAAELAQARTPPADWYTDPELAELERDAVFGRSWQVVARADQLVAAGSYVTALVGGEPVVAVRGADGTLRGFFNVCRHHAAAVATEECGTARQLRCPYHGWSYGLDGSLKGAPEFEGVADFDRSAHGLVPVAVAEWESFVLVCLDRSAPPLGEFLGGLASSLAPLGISRLSFFERRSYELRCNWKVFVDNYLDGGYHVPHLHKGLNGVLRYAEYTIENGERHCLQSSPLRSEPAGAGLGELRAGERAHYFWLYPNFMLNLYEGVMDTNLVLPLAVDRTRVVFDFYFADVGASARERCRASVEAAERIQDEDVAICESVQRGLGSRAYGAGRLSVRREKGEHLFHRLLAADLRRGSEPA